jgi:hypothetical protein
VTAKLCPKIPESFVSAAEFDDFFDEGIALDIREMERERELPDQKNPAGSCKTNLFFGFFFDGTKNNYLQGEAAGNQSNIARLYDCFPGQSIKGVLRTEDEWKNKPDAYKNFFKVYAPGVASPFPAIKDSGEGSDLVRGGAFGYLGEDRIKWALLQAINNIHRHFYEAPLLGPDETLSFVRALTLNKDERELMTDKRPTQYAQRNQPNRNTVDVFEKILKRLHAKLAIHWPDPVTKKPQKISPSEVKTIFVSAFGFSRGAAQARAFTNWFMSLCKLDAQLCGKNGNFSLGGFSVQFEFLGLFDTVASVGITNTLGNSKIFGTFDGHGAWADAEDSLRIHQNVKKCLHLVAPHEIRRSFPVDSVAVPKTFPANCQEIVFPGVHSDLGSGYCPLEQGRGVEPSGTDMLARLALLYMYREARKAGVPLKLELAGEKVKKKFKVSAKTIVALNQYLDFCSIKEGPLTQIMREQGRLQILWHKARRIGTKESIENSNSFSRATNFDKNDLHSANIEFENEIKNFEQWLLKKGPKFKPAAQDPGFDNNHENEWEEIATWWNNHARLPDRVLDFFDDYVHDSHAWFKLSSEFPDNEKDLHAQLVKWEKKRKWAIIQSETGSSMSGEGIQTFETAEELDGLTPDQRQAAQEFAKTGKTPRMITRGRESDSMFGFAVYGGYLRFRKIYGGGDKFLISERAQPGTPVEATT